MKLIPAKTPGFVKTLFPSFIWNINTEEKYLYLTFDDGPTPEITNWVLEALKAYNAKATFFCIGHNIEKFPRIFQDIINDGHTIGNHTFQHLKGWKHKTKAYVLDTEKAQGIINSYYNYDHNETSTSKLFRPPYGKLKTKQAKQLQKLNYDIVMWDVLSFDWDKTVSEIECLNNVLTTAKKGSIVVFHDSVKASKNLKYTLPKVLEYYHKQGFTFRSLT